MRAFFWLSLALAACRPEYGLQSVSADGDGLAAPSVPGSHDVSQAAEPEPVWTQVDVKGQPGAAVQIEVDAGLGLRREAFVVGGGASTPVVDFLFVVDGSTSMRHILDDVQAGFAALTERGVFPDQARIAVTSMLPGDPTSPNGFHAAVASVGAARWDPGANGLVDGTRITRAQRGFQIRDRYLDAGCDAWFEPEALNAQGVPCLVAHTQIPEVYYRVEAGLTAAGQRIAVGDLFRPGAAVNVVFVSDTHDPGANPDNPDVEELGLVRPTGAELSALANALQPLASFRLHAIAPASDDCGEPWRGLEASYFDAAEATGGETLDVCQADPNHYQRLIEAIAKNGAVPTQPVVALGVAAERVLSVRVDGEEVEWTAPANARALRLSGAMPTSRSRVEVEFEPARTARSARTARPSTDRAATPVRPAQRVPATSASPASRVAVPTGR